MAVCILVVNKVGDEVIEAWFDEMIIAGLISSEATMETAKIKKGYRNVQLTGHNNRLKEFLKS